MPTYDYACAACGHRFEVVHGVHGSGPDTCPNCGSGPVRKAFAPPTVLFKGSGWAKMDRRSTAAASKSSTPGDNGAAKPGKESKEGGSDAAPAASPPTGDTGAPSPVTPAAD